MYLFYNYFTFLKVYLNLYCPLISLFLLVFYFCNILGFFKRENKQRWITVSKQTHSRNHGFFFCSQNYFSFFFGKANVFLFFEKNGLFIQLFPNADNMSTFILLELCTWLICCFFYKMDKTMTVSEKKKKREKSKSQ